MRINDMISKMNSLDILTTSSHYFYKKCMGTGRENLHFDLGD